MDELDSLFTIDRCGSDDKCDQVDKSKKTLKSKDKSTILYKCDSNLLELKSNEPKHQKHKIHIPKQYNKRLHEAANGENKIQPGKLSDNLRKALGLSKYGLPLHIYRMRFLGYPPGWLRQIEMKPSELKFVGEDSKYRRDNYVEYRTDELIEYPGFNTLINYDPEEDHWKELGMIAMRKEHSMEEFSKNLQNLQQRASEKSMFNVSDVEGGIDTLEQYRRNILAQIQEIDMAKDKN